MSERKTYRLGKGARKALAKPKPWKCRECGGRLFSVQNTRDGADGASRTRQYKCLHCGADTFTTETVW